MTDVAMIYIGGANLTQTNFSQYYNGSEIVVAGEITNNDIETFSPGAVAFSVSMDPNTHDVSEFSEWFWKRLTSDFDREPKKSSLKKQLPSRSDLKPFLMFTSREFGLFSPSNNF